MELKFINKFFSESHSKYKNDFDMKPGTIISYYKLNSETPTILIKIGENDPTDFLEKRNVYPQIFFSEGLTYMYFHIEKTKDKLI